MGAARMSAEERVGAQARRSHLARLPGPTWWQQPGRTCPSRPGPLSLARTPDTDPGPLLTWPWKAQLPALSHRLFSGFRGAASWRRRQARFRSQRSLPPPAVRARRRMDGAYRPQGTWPGASRPLQPPRKDRITCTPCFCWVLPRGRF